MFAKGSENELETGGQDPAPRTVAVELKSFQHGSQFLQNGTKSDRIGFLELFRQQPVQKHQLD